jgi:hypothetical protein
VQGSISHPSDLLYSDVLVLFSGQPPCQTAYEKKHLAELQGVEEEVDEVLNLKFRKFLYFLRKIVIVILKLYRIGLRNNLLPQIDSF